MLLDMSHISCYYNLLFVVFHLDISPPEFSEDCASINVTAPQGQEYYEYRGTDLGATDNSGSVDVRYNLPPPVFLEEGAHSFVQTAVDKAGNEAVCAYTVNMKGWSAI